MNTCYCSVITVYISQRTALLIIISGFVIEAHVVCCRVSRDNESIRPDDYVKIELFINYVHNFQSSSLISVVCPYVVNSL